MQNLSAHQYFKQGSGIATLCGSTRFFPQCMEANRSLTFLGWIVLMCGSWGHSYHKDAEEIDRDYTAVKRLHFHKILESDVIVVVSDESFYCGESTTEEIAFARHRQKPVYYYDGKHFSGFNHVLTVPDRYADNSLIEGFRKKFAKA